MTRAAWAVAIAIAVVAAAAVVVAMRGGSGEVVIEMSWSVGDSCPDAAVIGVAGSGQRDDELGVGPQVASAVSSFTAQLTEQSSSDVTVGFTALDYPAPSVVEGGLFGFLGNSIFDSIDEGRDLLVESIRSVVAGCDGTTIYLIGYSQGASVVHAAVMELDEPLRAGIGGVAVLANPNRDADDPNTQHFTTELPGDQAASATPHTRDGVLEPMATPDWLAGTFYSACARRDAVCNSSLIDLFVTEVVHSDERYNGLGPELGRVLADRFLSR